MNKYQKAMEYLYVDKAMYDRILQGIQKAAARRKKRFRQTILVIGGIAAVITILAVNPRIKTSYLTTETDESPPMTEKTSEDENYLEPNLEIAMDASADDSITEYTSADELSKAVGFEVEEFTNLPFRVSEISYQETLEKTAEIIYTHNDQTLYYSKTAGSSAFSEDYYDYEQTKEVPIASETITLKGDSQKIYLALWSDKDYSYVIEDSKGLTEDTMLELVSQICNYLPLP